MTSKQRESVNSGTKWEAMGGYSRAVRFGDRVLVSGTSAVGPDGLVGENDPAAQANFIIDKIETALEQLGSNLKDVVCTRVYIVRLDDWEEVVRVHGERFKDIRPVNTLVQAALVGDGYLVEIEAEAMIGAGDAIQ